MNSGDCLDNNDNSHEPCIFESSKALGEETIENMEADIPQRDFHSSSDSVDFVPLADDISQISQIEPDMTLGEAAEEEVSNIDVTNIFDVDATIYEGNNHDATLTDSVREMDIEKLVMM